MKEFWVSSGHHMTLRAEGGGLIATDELIEAYLARPELMPPDEACNAERALHASLMEKPRRPVEAAEIARLGDPDARENWRFMIAFRDALLSQPTIEATYIDLVRRGFHGLPPLFADHMVHLILRNALDGEEDPYVLRAGELFFRPQHAGFHEGSLLLADWELIESETQARNASPLLAMMGHSPLTELDVMDDANAWTYWSRSDGFSMAMNIGSNPKARAGLARVIERWGQASSRFRGEGRICGKN